MSILSTGEGKAAARLQRRPEADFAVHPTADLVATADRRALPCSLGFSLEPLDGGAGALDLGSRSPSPTFELPALEFLGPGSGQVAHSGATLGARPSHPDQISPRPGAAEQSDERGEVGSVPRGSGDQPATEERTAPSSSAAPPHEGPAAGARAAADGGVNKPPELAPLLRVAAPGGRLQAEEERRRGWMARWLRPSLVVRILLAAAVVAFAVQYAASRVLLHASVDGVVRRAPGRPARPHRGAGGCRRTRPPGRHGPVRGDPVHYHGRSPGPAQLRGPEGACGERGGGGSGSRPEDSDPHGAAEWPPRARPGAPGSRGPTAHGDARRGKRRARGRPSESGHGPERVGTRPRPRDARLRVAGQTSTTSKARSGGRARRSTACAPPWTGTKPSSAPRAGACSSATATATSPIHSRGLRRSTLGSPTSAPSGVSHPVLWTIGSAMRRA